MKLSFANADIALLVLRVCVGGVMLPHGAQKLLGMFNGGGYKATMSYFTGTMKLPWLVAFLVIIAEFFGSAFLVLGFGARICALALIAVMIGAIVTTCYKNGFFMNWYGNQQGEGYEYHLLIIGILAAITVSGAGKYSLDNLF
jgi:putative oxidoreductase